MFDALICPLCLQSFPEEDYCPEHGLPLQAAAQPTPSSPATTTPLPLTTAEPVQAVEAIPEPPQAVRATPTRRPVSDAPPKTERKTGSAFDRIADVMARMKLRPAKGTDDGTAPRTLLPEEATEQGWVLDGPVESCLGGIDRWPVVRQPEMVKGYFHRYRGGSLTTVPVYRRLAVLEQQPDLPRVWLSGSTDFTEARCDYDLVSPPEPPGVELDRWLAGSTPSEQRALHLLGPLAALLTSLQGKGLRPIVLDPALIERTPDGSLRLGVTGVLEDAATEGRYRADVARNPLLSNWAAPELLQTHMLHPNAGVFGAGQVMAHAVWGQACSHTDLSSGAIAFGTIADARLARVLMGCLWPDAQGRWSADDLARAAVCADGEAMPPVRSWASLTPGASSTAFGFAGASHWRLDALLAEAVRSPARWIEAAHNVDAILAWADGTVWSGRAALLREARRQGRSRDWALVALIRAVRPDSPLTWRHLDLGDETATASLVALAQRALRGDADEQAAVRDLFQADLRGAFIPAEAGVYP